MFNILGANRRLADAKSFMLQENNPDAARMHFTSREVNEARRPPHTCSSSVEYTESFGIDIVRNDTILRSIPYRNYLGNSVNISINDKMITIRQHDKKRIAYQGVVVRQKSLFLVL